jgi:hypothetical protein
MAHNAMLDKECQQYPRIKKFLKRSRAVDKLRSLSKFCQDANIPKAHQEYIFKIHAQSIFEAVLQSSEELNAQSLDAQQNAPSMFDVFKKDKHIKWEDFKPPLLVLRQLLWFQRELFRTGWKASSLQTFLSSILNPAIRHEFRLLGIDCLVVIIDTLRTVKKTDRNHVTSYQPYITVLQNIFQQNTTYWLSSSSVQSHQMTFALAQPSSNANISRSSPGRGSNLSPSFTTTTGATTTTTSANTSTIAGTTAGAAAIEFANKIFLFTANNSHSNLDIDAAKRLLFWFDVILHTIGAGAFGYSSMPDSFNLKDSAQKEKKENDESGCDGGEQILSFDMDVSQVKLRSILINWIVNRMFEGEFAAVALSNENLSSLVFKLFSQMFPTDHKSPDWGQKGAPFQVQVLILTWYSSVVDPENRHGLLQNRNFFEEKYFPLMIDHAAKSIGLRGEFIGGGGGHHEGLALSGIQFFEKCTRHWRGNLPDSLWFSFKKCALDAVTTLSLAAQDVTDSLISYSYGTRLVLEIWLRCPDLDDHNTWLKLQNCGVHLLRTKAAVAVWKKYILSITEKMLCLTYPHQSQQQQQQQHERDYRNEALNAVSVSRNRGGVQKRVLTETMKCDTNSSTDIEHQGKKEPAMMGTKNYRNGGKPRTHSLSTVRESIPMIVQRTFLKLHGNISSQRVQATKLFSSVLRIVSLGKSNNCVSNEFKNAIIRNEFSSTFGAIIDVWVSVSTFGVSPTIMGLLTVIGPWIFQACATSYFFNWSEVTVNALVKNSDEMSILSAVSPFRALCAIMSVRASKSEMMQHNRRLRKLLLRSYEILNVGLGMRSENDFISPTTGKSNQQQFNPVTRAILLNGASILGAGHEGVSLLLPSFLGALQCIHRKRLKIPSRTPKSSKSHERSTNATENPISRDERSKAVVILTSMMAPKRSITVPSLSLWSIHHNAKNKGEKLHEKNWYQNVPYFVRQLLALKLLLHIHENETDQNLRAQCVYSISLGLYHRMKLEPNEIDKHEEIFDRVCNLRNVLHDRCLREELRLYCESEYSSENVEFWLATECYRELTTIEERKEKASKILVQFIGSSAPQQVNLPAKISTKLMSEVGKELYDVELFQESQEEIFHLLRKDTMPRFRASLKTFHRNLSDILLDRLFQQINIPAPIKQRNDDDSSSNDVYLPCLAAVWSVATLASWNNNTFPRVVLVSSLTPSTFVIRLSKRIKALATDALNKEIWGADHLLTQLLLALQEWLFVPAFQLDDNGEHEKNMNKNILPQSLLSDSEISDAVFGSLEACLCFGCGGNIVPKDFDNEYSLSSARKSNRISSSSALIRVLRLLKNKPDLFAENNYNEGKDDSSMIHLRPCFFLTEALIKMLQHQFDVYPNLQGPASCSTVVREPFMRKESTVSSIAQPSSSSESTDSSDSSDSSEPRTIVFGYQSRIMSLTEMPPNKSCRLSRVRFVVRDVTGRYCWDLIPASADSEGSETLCYHRADDISNNSENVKDDQTSSEGGGLSTTTLEPPPPVFASEITLEATPSSVITERISDLLKYIDTERTDASVQFGRFITKFDPHKQNKESKLSNDSSIKATEIMYRSQLIADRVNGLGSATLQKSHTKEEKTSASGKGKKVTVGAPESGCQPVYPTIQNGRLTSFDRCRQALAHVSLSSQTSKKIPCSFSLYLNFFFPIIIFLVGLFRAFNAW